MLLDDEKPEVGEAPSESGVTEETPSEQPAEAPDREKPEEAPTEGGGEETKPKEGDKPEG